MKQIRLYVFGYRDQSFWCQYGPIVRDLMMISALSELDAIDSITFYNRPVSVPELVLGKKKIKYPHVGNEKIKFFSKLSLDLLGPLKRRLWVKGAYKDNYPVGPIFSPDYINVVLDFLPIGDMPSWVAQADLYWYDLIDNFTKHNRFTKEEKNLVVNKYSSIKTNQSCFVTGVSKGALDKFHSALLIPNAILEIPKVSSSVKKYDFGFMGFVTNKLDLDTIIKLAELDYSIAIYGDIYDKEIGRKLAGINNVDLLGGFSNADIGRILGSFKVGLIPYNIDMLHDESPLKLFQYMVVGMTVLSSYGYEMNSESLILYDQSNLGEAASLALNHDYVVLDPVLLESYLWSSRVGECVQGIRQHVK